MYWLDPIYFSYLFSFGRGGFAIGSGAYEIGVALNWWNPVGWVGGIAMGTAAISCGAYAIFG